MKVSEDRFPLLLVYLEEQEEERNMRARSITRGAAEILGKWPQYLTFVTYISVLGLLSLLVCFVLSVFVLSLTPRELHNPKKFSLVKCDKENDFRLTNIDVDAENATFIVDVPGDDQTVASCAIESYLTWTSLPVYHVRLVRSDRCENASVFAEFEKKFKNYRVLTVPVSEFLRGTSFATANGDTLRFVSKILISWNFGGVVLDSDLIALSNFRSLLPLGEDDHLVMGLIDPDNVLISSRRVCHSFVFALMKQVTRVGSPATPAEIVRIVWDDFCGPGRNCTGIRVLSKPYFCESERDGCVFMKNGNSRVAWSRVCPVAKFFSGEPVIHEVNTH